MLSVHILMSLQAGLDTWIKHYNEEKAHSGTYRFGKNGQANIPGFNAAGQKENIEQYLADRRSMFLRLSIGYYIL